MNFKEELEKKTGKVEDILAAYLPKPEGFQSKVLEAMVYAVSAGGKRLRPLMMAESAALFVEAEEVWRTDGTAVPKPATARALPVFMAAIEFIHTYSLIHDDLPCMDDDALRRGKPTCHVKYSEWLALLAGDALQAAAFERLALSSRTTPQANAKACEVLAVAAGRHNMCAGQYLDIVEEGNALDVDRLTQIHLHKTSALLGAACLLGLTASPVEYTEQQWVAALDYAKELGLAFQIRDDMLDVESTAEELGKPIGSDADNGKTTFATLYGLDRCRELVEEHPELAKGSISGACDRPEFLCALADSLAKRKN